MTKLIYLATVAAILSTTAPAFADETADFASRPVSAAGVDFRDRAAVQAFYARLQGAAEAVCDTYPARGRVSQEDQACVATTLAKTVRKVDRPILSALYQSRNGRSAPQHSTR